MSNRFFVGAAAALATLLASTAVQAGPAKPSKVQKMQTAAAADVPKCARKIGTLSIANGDDPSGWSQFSLAPPAKLLKVLVQRSGCFNLVDRGTGLNAAQLERDIGGGMGLQRGSNVGRGQIKSADYVLVAEVQAADKNAGGSGIGAGLGRAVGGWMGGIVGGIGSKKLEANTVLSLTNVRTTETVAVEEGHAAKNDITFGGGALTGLGNGWGAGAIGGGYEDTDIGRIVTLAFIEAYSKLVQGIGGLQPGAAEAAPAKAFRATALVSLRKAPNPKGALIRTLPAGSEVYPTGNKEGMWWEVADENDNVGWTLNTKLAPSS
ncbi:CsgG/HfaB family protein [Sphingomonas jatrophae]|uniref:Curli biogenesis system outer membrane secretion channel CsgG n=1 Tax=Sphingomonas jatrophae TaxID=1166337 RepID=A0A1I6LFT9_9SPHN|nr:CsgG/HfaB family protein [Sphingomonas jatrophae]SFS02334.1 Curli biogenesis system outer membrane secretion channel CsgG [Sphingomonas jatrophae]